MERHCVKSIGLERDLYEQQSNTLIEDIKGIREMIVRAEDSEEKNELLEELLVAIDSLIGNKEAFEKCVSIAISSSEDYTALTYFEGENILKRIYDDVELMPTYCILGHDLKTFIFVRELYVLPNPQHQGRKSDVLITMYTIEGDKVVARNLTDTEFVYKVNSECLEETKEFVEATKRKILENK